MCEPVWWSTTNPTFDNALTALAPETIGSLGRDFCQLFFYGWRNGLVMLPEAGKVALNGIGDVGERFLPRLPFGHGAGKGGTLGDVDSVFVLVDGYAVFHNQRMLLTLFNILRRDLRTNVDFDVVAQKGPSQPISGRDSLSGWSDPHTRARSWKTGFEYSGLSATSFGTVTAVNPFLL